MRRVRWLAVLLAAALAAPLQAQCTLSWVDAASGLWDSPANWNENRVPNDADTVCITVDGEYTVELRGRHTVEAVVVGSGTTVTPGPTLEISDVNGHMTVTTSAMVHGSGRLSIDFFSSSPGNFGVLDGAGDVTLVGRLDWGGEIAGTGAFVAEGPTALTRSPRLRGRTVVTEGPVTVEDNVTVDLSEDATLENRGTMIWEEVGTSERGVRGVGSAPHGTFVNVGTLRQQGDNRVAFDVPVANTGAVEVVSGQVQFRKDTDHRGAAFTVADGARLEFSNQNIAGVFPLHVVDAATTADIAGTLAVLKAAILTVSADWTVAGTVELEPSAGEAWLTGDGDLTTAGLVWGPGTVITGDGAFVVTGDNPAMPSDQRGGILRGRTLRVAGSLTISSIATLEWGGRLEVGAGGEVVVVRGLRAGPRAGAVANEGTLTVARRLAIDVLIESSGTIVVEDGVQFLIARGGLSCMGGTIDVDAGEELRLEGGVGRLDGCGISGGGKVTAWTDAEFVVDGAGATVGGSATLETSATGVLSGMGPVTVAGGTLRSAGAFRPGASPGTFAVVGSLMQQGGTVEVELGGLVPGTEHDRITTTGTFTADGTLVVTFVDLYRPVVGDRFVIATCGVCAGAFDRVTPPGDYTFDLEATATEITLVVTGATAGEAGPVALDVLTAPAPNPTAGPARVGVAVSAPGSVVVAVFDALGREVARLHDGPLAAGVAHAFEVDATAWGGGLYFVRALGPTITATRALTVVR